MTVLRFSRLRVYARECPACGHQASQRVIETQPHDKPCPACGVAWYSTFRPATWVSVDYGR